MRQWRGITTSPTPRRQGQTEGALEQAHPETSTEPHPSGPQGVSLGLCGDMCGDHFGDVVISCSRIVTRGCGQSQPLQVRLSHRSARLVKVASHALASLPLLLYIQLYPM